MAAPISPATDCLSKHRLRCRGRGRLARVRLDAADLLPPRPSCALDQEWFFSSETPEVTYSPGFRRQSSRLRLLAAFRDRETRAELTVVNVHFDHASGANRVRSAELVAQRIEPWLQAGRTVILAGELNAMTGWRTYAILDEAGLDFVPVAGSTYHFNRGLHVLGAIDHIAASGGVERVGDAQVLRGRVDGEWPPTTIP